MTTNYAIVDFRALVSKWYNEFLPAKASEKARFVDDAGIVYLNALDLDKLFVESVKFMSWKAAEYSSPTTIAIVVREPKPVNNARLTTILRTIDESPNIDQAHKEKVLHVANRRYIVSSETVLVAQDKEIDGFMERVFDALARKPRQNVRFYSSQSLPFGDVCLAASRFFPKSALSIVKESNVDASVRVVSSNDTIAGISLRLVVEEGAISTESMFLGKCVNGAIHDFERMV